MAIEDARKLNLSYVELKASKMGKPLYEKLGFTVTESKYVPMIYRFDK